MRSLARVSSCSSVSRAITSRCKAAAARASASRNGGRSAGRERLALGRLGLRAGALGDHAHGGILGLLGLGELGIGGDPAQVKQRRLGLAHLLGDGAVADRLPRLPS